MPKNFIKLDNPNLPVIDGLGSSGLPVAQFVDVTENSQNQLDTIGEVNQTRDMFLPSFSFRAFDGIVHRDAVLVNEEDNGGDLLGSCIFLESKVFSYMPEHNGPIGTFNRSHNFKFDPHNEMVHYLPANSKLNYVHFSYKPEFLDQLLPANERWADNLRNHFSRRLRLAGKEAKHLSEGQERALQNIFDCPLQGKWAEMMIESSFAQLILLQMHALFNTDDCTVAQGFSKKDIDMMYSVKEHLTNSFLSEHSMTQLAKHFGTNTNKLMVTYKRLFGKSIFEHLTELRMEYAAKLLRDEDRMVIEVAHVLGYKNPNHFSAAFKRRFGITPSEYK